MRVWLAWALAGCIPILGFALPAPEGQWAFRSYGTAQGLDNSAVWALAQDRTGFLWIGTEDGVFRFDGRRFRAFRLRDGLPSTSIQALHATLDGGLWVGTQRGLARRVGGRFEAVPASLGLPEGPVACLASGPQGELWVGTPGGPFRQASSGRFHPVEGWPGGAATALAFGPEGREAWAAVPAGAGSRILRFAAGHWRTVDAAPAMGEERIHALQADASGRVWARGAESLFLLEPGRGYFRALDPGPGKAGSRGFLAGDGAGSLWTTAGQGIARLRDGRWQHLGLPQGLRSGPARAVLVDREGGLWIGSGSGLYRLLCGGAWQAFPAGALLPEGYVWGVFRDLEGRLLAGSDAGLLRWQAEGWRLVRGTEGFQVRSLARDGDGTLLVGGGPQVLRVDPRGGVLQRFGAAQGLNPDGRVLRLCLEGDTLWVATEGAGLFRGQRKGKGWNFRPEPLPGASGRSRVNDLQRDGAGRLWVAGERGLYLREGEGWRRFGREEGLRDVHVACLCPTRDGGLVLAYFEPHGLCRARLEGGRLRVLEHLDAFFPAEKIVYMLGEDRTGGLWVGSAHGLDLLRADGSRDHFGAEDGLVGEDVDNQAFLAEADGTVWVGTSAGIARFASASLPRPARPPRAEVVDVGDGEGLQALPLGTPLALRSGSALDVRFAALSFARQGGLQYQARVVGLDEAWHPADEGYERYAGLRPGSFRFEVRARRGDGEWGEPTSFPFRVLPAWWQTLAFRGACVLALLGLAALGVWWRLKHLTRRTRSLEGLIEARTRELAQANEALRRQSLTDPLTGMRNRRYLAAVMPEDVARARREHRNLPVDRESVALLNIALVFIMVDLDHFKEVNDRFGHAAGDRVLQQVGEILEAATRDSDTVIRWGGEEFLVVARDATRTEGTILVERIHSMVALQPFDLGQGQTIHLTCSLGFTFFPFVPDRPEHFGWERAVDLADHCLYAAKRSGRDAWVGVFPALQGDVEQLEERLPQDIAGLLREGQLELKCNLPAGHVLRWES